MEVNYRYRFGNNVEYEIKRIVNERFEQSIEQLNNETVNPDKANHQMRKNMKKVRAALRLVRHAAGEPIYKELNITARDIARLGAEFR